MVKGILEKGYGLLDSTKKLDFLAPLLMRLYLVPIFWMAGTNGGIGTSNGCVNRAVGAVPLS